MTADWKKQMKLSLRIFGGGTIRGPRVLFGGSPNSFSPENRRAADFEHAGRVRSPSFYSIPLERLSVCLFVVLTNMVAAELIQDIKPLPLTPVEQADLDNKQGKLRDLPWRFTPYNVQRPRQPKRVESFGDR